jgi:hypothetical protein
MKSITHCASASSVAIGALNISNGPGMDTIVSARWPMLRPSGREQSRRDRRQVRLQKTAGREATWL